MLSNIIESDTKALAKVFSNKEFYRPVDGNKKDYKTYLADIVSEDLRKVVLPKEIIPNQVTLNVFAFAYRKDSSILPILLKYFTYKNLLKEAKGDLDKINQKLQGVMDEELKKLQDEQKLLRKETSELSGKEVDVKQGKVLVTKSEKITEISSKVEKIKLCKENIKNLLNGDKVKLRFYPPQYFSILNSGLIEIIEKKLTAYVKDDTNIENIYQSLNNKAKKIIISGNIKIALQTSSLLVFLPVFTLSIFTPLLAQMLAGPSQLQRDMFYFFHALLTTNSATNCCYTTCTGKCGLFSTEVL
ncbi:hypothetical protein [Wolbachia endosymbiont of Armadillidium arcangelii]|uniref:Uncharacterized protein n=1 Tax=Wolbachia endosymbiont of Armadillidium arcangelii TaxID=3158571 RepID=A0AAU7Q0Y0_9RICK